MPFLYSYNEQSEGAKQLAQALGIKRIKHENSHFTPTPHKKVINWGASSLSPSFHNCILYNKPEHVRDFSNKLNFFRVCEARARIPAFTTDINIVMGWLADGHEVCQRAVLNGHSGAGLTILNRNHIDDLRIVPLYTKYIKKKEEFRIHFAFGEVIDIQRKALRSSVDKSTVNFKIRNLENGFVFVRNNINEPNDVRDQALRFIELTSLDFGAIDIIYNEKEDKAYLLEVNTAPGLCGQTVESYAAAFRKKFEE